MRVEATGHGLTTDDTLTSEERGDELLLMGLRLAEGIEIARYEATSGRRLDPVQIEELRRHGLIEITDQGWLRVTLAGFPVLDAVVADLAA
jgi:coproporphyrinogen III oxidase-like Fe-S oxidoreductase